MKRVVNSAAYDLLMAKLPEPVGAFLANFRESFVAAAKAHPHGT